eukprot:168218_1
MKKPLKRDIVKNWYPNVGVLCISMMLMTVLHTSHLQKLFLFVVVCAAALAILFYIFKLPPASTKFHTKLLPSVFGHRGAVRQPKIDENTLSAFELAYECNAMGIESDIRFTKDNIPIVVHDYHLLHLTDEKSRRGLCSVHFHELTLAEIKQIKLKQNEESEIMTLDELIEWMNAHPYRKENQSDHFCLLLDLKYHASGSYNDQRLESIIQSVNKITSSNERVVVISFSISIIYHLRKRDLNLNVGICFNRNQWYDWIVNAAPRPPGIKERILYRFRDPIHTFCCRWIVPSLCGCTCVMIDYSLLSAHVIQHYFDNDIAVCCWGSSGIDTKWLLSKGVCCLVDDPQKAMQLL